MKLETNQYSKILYVWNSVSALFVYGGVTIPHSHSTMQLVFDIRDTFKCRINDMEWMEVKAVIIKENVIHQLDTNDGIQLLLYLDAECEIAKNIKLKYLPDNDICSLNIDILENINPGELEQCLIKPDPELLKQIVDCLLSRLTANQRINVSDERIITIINLLKTDGSEKMTIKYLAKKIFLSESRVRFLFKKVTGIPLHRFIIWNRIMLAIGKILNGSAIKDAAMEFGFTDSSHFHKMLLQMFGVSPSQFIKNNEKRGVQILTRFPMNMETRFFDSSSTRTDNIYKI
jgi:AraC-like DNA-binding protein